VQLGLSFGHVHGSSGPPPAAAVSVANTGHSPPSGDNSGDNDYCATCAILAMLAGANAASAPVLAMPIVLATAEPPCSPAEILTETRHFAFQSRAPPQA
jgi:hypothetical protein